MLLLTRERAASLAQTARPAERHVISDGAEMYCVDSVEGNDENLAFEEL